MQLKVAIKGSMRTKNHPHNLPLAQNSTPGTYYYIKVNSLLHYSSKFTNIPTFISKSFQKASSNSFNYSKKINYCSKIFIKSYKFQASNNSRIKLS